MKKIYESLIAIESILVHDYPEAYKAISKHLDNLELPEKKERVTIDEFLKKYEGLISRRLINALKGNHERRDFRNGEWTTLPPFKYVDEVNRTELRKVYRIGDMGLDEFDAIIKHIK
jgi:hypothetical protein